MDRGVTDTGLGFYFSKRFSNRWVEEKKKKKHSPRAIA